MDKEEIINLARKIGTFETSILPYPDCCTLFSPSHPLIHPDFAEIVEGYEALSLEDLIRESVRNAERVMFERGEKT
jgi:thiamine biosynthesis protein ThiI